MAPKGSCDKATTNSLALASEPVRGSMCNWDIQLEWTHAKYEKNDGSAIVHSMLKYFKVSRVNV